MSTENDKGKHIDDLLKRSEEAEKSFDPRVTKLAPGKYSFEVELATFKREPRYECLYVQLRVSPTVKTSDRFPLTADWAWKLQAFAAAIQATGEELANPETLVGRTGKLVTEKNKEWVVYRFVDPNAPPPPPSLSKVLRDL